MPTTHEYIYIVYTVLLYIQYIYVEYIYCIHTLPGVTEDMYSLIDGYYPSRKAGNTYRILRGLVEEHSLSEKFVASQA